MIDTFNPRIAEYVTHPSGTIHMIDQDVANKAGAYLIHEDVWSQVIPTTLCGIVVGWEADGWSWGDETMSGISATCKRCRTIFKRKPC